MSKFESRQVQSNDEGRSTKVKLIDGSVDEKASSSADELNELILVLDLDTRDKLINNLTVYQTMFSELGWDQVILNKLTQIDNVLVHTLMNLKSKDELVAELNSTRNRYRINRSASSDSQSYQIKWSLRMRLIDSLIKNNFVAKHIEQTTRQVRRLIDENEAIIQELERLTILDCKEDYSSLDDSDRSDVGNEIDQKLANFKQAIIGQLVEQIQAIKLAIKVNMGQLRGEFNERIATISNRKRFELSYLFRIANAQNFIRFHQRRRSPHFYIHNIPFFLSVSYQASFLENQFHQNYLTIFLCCAYRPLREWSIKTEFSFQLISHSSSSEDRTLQCCFEFKKAEVHGSQQFIGHSGN